MTDDLVERFEQRLIPEPNTGCWLWIGVYASSHMGYGEFYAHGRRQYAHRFSYEAFKGSATGLCVLHRCDVPICVNPDHLFLGTKKDNTNDMLSKRREAFGSRTGAAKLTAEQARRIKYDTRGCKRLSKEYGVSTTTIQDIRHGRLWVRAIEELEGAAT